MRRIDRGIQAVAWGAAMAAAASAHGQFQVFQGNAATEAAWRTAAGGNVPLETFEGYNGVSVLGGSPSDVITSLPGLGVTLRGFPVTAAPGIYVNAQYALGDEANVELRGGLAQYADYTIFAMPGRAITALGYWQCDPQNNATAYAYSEHGWFVGQISALANNGSGNSFAGFVSVTPIAFVIMLGTGGDGWTHIDDLQIKTTGGACSLADIGTEGNPSPSAGPDGFVTGVDFDVFVIAFFGSLRRADNQLIADLTDGTGTGWPDGYLTGTDFDLFVQLYFAGC